MNPVSGEQHERAAENARFAAAEAIRDWIHEQPFSLCNAGSDTCPDWPMAFAVRTLALDAYLVSLREQGVRLVDLRDVVEFVRDQGSEDEHGYRDHFDPDDLADAIERRFGGNERSE